MATKQRVATGILSDEHTAKREAIVELLTRAYWMEMETVMSYLANAAHLDGIRAEEIAEALSADVDEELGHARRFAERIKELYGTPPGSIEFTPEQSSLQPPVLMFMSVHICTAEGEWNRLWRVPSKVCQR